MTKTSKDYQSLRGELDEVMGQLQSQDIDVDQAIALYERGMKLVVDIETYLEKAQNKVKKIKADFDK